MADQDATQQQSGSTNGDGVRKHNNVEDHEVDPVRGLNSTRVADQKLEVSNGEKSVSDSSEEDKRHQEKKEKKKSKVPARSAQVVPYFKLFSFADPLDYLLMTLGTIGSIGNGMTLPIMTLILGGLINAFGDNQNANQQVIHAVSKVRTKDVLESPTTTTNMVQ
jgi:ATP-binding cassette subfamily B (MDR/TAP) protein 1